MTRPSILFVLPALLIGLAACGSGELSGDSAPSASTSATPSPEPSPTTAIGVRCGLPDVDAEQLTWKSPRGAVLDGAVVGTGTTVVVFLHQTDGAGFCGFWSYANHLADEEFRSVLVDLCGYGQADCGKDSRFANRPIEQVRLPVEWARAHGAERVVLVGASMGGSIALGSAEALEVDAVVDLSGPATWRGVASATKAARTLTVPALVVASPIDTSTDAAVLEQAVASMPSSHKRFVKGPNGEHGWDLLEDYPGGGRTWTKIARMVQEWAAGSYD